MFELNQSQFISVKHFLKDIKCDTVFGYSIVENRQKGRIFVDDINNPTTVLFWHWCGFAFIYGLTNNNCFNKLLQLLLSNQYEENQRRFVLFINDNNWNDAVKKLLANNINVKVTERLRFRFNHKLFQNINNLIANQIKI